MKRLVIALLGVGIVGGTAYVATNVGSSLEVVNPRVVTEREEVTHSIEEEIDPIDKARAELERINQELDKAEQEGIAKREAIIATHNDVTAKLKAEYEARVKELEAERDASLQVTDTELDKIRETRTGF